MRNWLRFFLLPVLGVAAWAQGPPQGRGGPPPTPRAGAPVDLTGYWVSIVTEDWRFRMFTPPKGDFAGVPLNAEGTKVGQAWDPAKDEAAGQQCKSYGMPALMRVAGRFHVTWDNDTTLKIEADSGTQTRLLHFGAAPAQPGSYTERRCHRHLSDRSNPILRLLHPRTIMRLCCLRARLSRLRWRPLRCRQI